jgi:DNA-binding transcriptional LysR family regulator
VGLKRRPLAGIDANLLVVLDAILETGSVAESAKQLGLSASAVSHALARLREMVGDPILVRAGRKMTLTARAKAIAPALREGLARVASSVEEPKAFAPEAEERVVRIGAIDFATRQILPKVLDVLRREAPRVDVVVTQFDPRSLDALAAGELDLVLALRRTQAKARQAVLLHEPFVSMIRKGHPALAEKMTPKRFAALPHALVSPTSTRRASVDDELEKLGLSRRVALVVPTLAAAAAAVAESDMVVTGSRREALAAAKHLPLELFDPPVPLAPFAVAMFWHERDHKDPFSTWLRGRIAAVSGEGSASRRTDS